MIAPEQNLLYSRRGRDSMEVVDEGEHRSLYFKGSVIQSRMSLADPSKLVLRYTRYMMASSLLVCPHPTRALLIGVGAGSLLHFFNHYLPNCQLDGVDYSSEILEIARAYFRLPESDTITIHCDDGLRYLEKLDPMTRYDLILIDAFTDDGMARTVYSDAFLHAARTHLTASGVVCTNLWSGRAEAYNRVKKGMLKAYPAALFIPVRRRENRIGLLFQSPVPWTQVCPAPASLDLLNQTYDLEFSEVSGAARKYNMKFQERLQYLFR